MPGEQKIMDNKLRELWRQKETFEQYAKGLRYEANQTHSEQKKSHLLDKALGEEQKAKDVEAEYIKLKEERQKYPE